MPLTPTAWPGLSSILQVKVKTSDVRGAGTDSNVVLTMYGKYEGAKRDSGPHKLDNSANNFERNMVDEFVIKSRDLGELTHIVVSTSLAARLRSNALSACCK